MLIDKHTASGRFDAAVGHSLLTSRERQVVALRKQIDQAKFEYFNLSRVIHQQHLRAIAILERMNDLQRRYDAITQTTD